MKSKKSETWYVVFVGASPGIYSRYDEVKRYTQSISKSYFKKYDTKKEALIEEKMLKRQQIHTRKELKEYRKFLRENMTLAEAFLWSFLKAKKLIFSRD